ncbi:WD40 repeat domain-containing protein [Streptomyces abyssomicinicus]|uniref:WD40 repeat domain-containing protein n=1 Tax=Streptomyces abyssomicinicus TaxID=574929 RepID=UPI0012509D03|nr:WD40 repeat domain-containing protein [Streptomyces abyssomicinicus]
MRRSLASLAGALVLTAGGAVAGAAPAVADEGGGFTLQDPRITESSGLAASRRHPGVYWTHNDSEDGSRVFAVDGRTGRTVATVTLAGVGQARDIEAVSVGPDGRVYVGDIGDNFDGGWDHVWIYAFEEPKELRDATVRATQYVVRYEGGARDAESLAVHPGTGRVYIVDKRREGDGRLFAGPERLSAQGVNLFRPVADVNVWATDAAFSPDGAQLAVRGYLEGVLLDWNGGRPEERERLSPPFQGQGESLTYSADGRLLLFGSEGEGSRVVARPAPEGASAGSPDASSPGSPSSSSPAGGPSSGEDGGRGGNEGSVTLGGVAVVAAVVGLWAAARRRRAD